MVSSPAGLYSTDARLGAGTVFGFDGTGGVAVPSIAFAPRIDSDRGTEAANWGRVNSNRILHSADIQSGVGTLDGVYVNQKRREQNKTVWETMMPTEPSKLLRRRSNALRSILIPPAGRRRDRRSDDHPQADMTIKRLSLTRDAPRHRRPAMARPLRAGRRR